MPPPSAQDSKAYYDAFSKQYERIRGKNAPLGYHELLDQLEAEFVARYAAGKEVLEVGCGTGLVLERIAGFAKRAVGVDLSPGMLSKARERGLEVFEGSATKLPFENASFDVCCSFKVLPHVPEIDVALSEMARVTRPGGVIIAEFYNPDSFRGLIKRFGPKQRIAEGKHEGDVFTRFDTPTEGCARAPDGCRFIDSRGIRIAVPFGAMMQVPGLRSLLRKTERALCDSPLQRFAGFWVAAYLKEM